VKHIFWIGVMALGLAACKSNRAVQGDRNLPNRKTEELLALMEEQELKCDWLSIKYDVEIESEKFEDSFKMYVRLKQDSVIWISATYYAVEVARFLFTPDTVKFMDRKNNQYYIGDYEYIKDRFEVEMNFEILQALMMSNSVTLLRAEDEAEKIRTMRDDGMYFISFLRKGQLRRAMRKDEDKQEIDLNVGLWIDPSSYRLARTSINDLESDRTLTAEYGNYQAVCNSSFPHETTYTAVSANEQAKVKTSVIKLTTGKELSLSFTIPEKYEALAP
jgi:hypothetical protein